MLQFRILGPLEVCNDAGLIELGGQRQRALLALLLLRANEIVATDSLVDALWGERPPRTATASLQNGISQLRKLLGADVVETSPPGYRLRVAHEQVDAVVFERLMREARTLPPEERAKALAEALALWRGEPLADMRFEPFAQDEIRRLVDRRLVALQERIDTEIACGRHADVVSEAEGLVAANPLHEGLRGLLMVALYRSGRQAEALQTFYACRTALDDGHGQQPSAKLQEIYLAILRQDSALAPATADVRAPSDHYGEIARAVNASRLVSVLGPDIGASTTVPGPAAAAEHLARHFECPAEAARGLAHVAEFVAITHGVGPLYDELHALYGGDFAPGPVHRSLAALALLLRARGLPGQLLLTSGYDRTLERAFADAGEEFDVVSYVAVGRDRGKFLHIPHGGSARVIDEPNLEAGLAAPERTMILRLNGGTDELSDRVRDSYVVSEDDYIDYLAQSEASALLPVGLAARIRRSHLLFMGYGLDDWSPRVFLRRLWGAERIAYRSWAIDATAGRATTEHWRQLGVEVLDAAADTVLDELRRRLDGGDAAAA